MARPRKFDGLTPVERVRRFRAERVAAGLCADCGAARDRTDVTRCDACMAKSAARVKPMPPDVQRRLLREQKAAALALFGGVCSCCGEGALEFLTLDHVDDDGAEHRRELTGAHRSSGSALYGWVTRYRPATGFRVLCFNCHLARTYYGRCPHEPTV